jgi:hypothetical protein
MLLEEWDREFSESVFDMGQSFGCEKGRREVVSADAS